MPVGREPRVRAGRTSSTAPSSRRRRGPARARCRPSAGRCDESRSSAWRDQAWYQIGRSASLRFRQFHDRPGENLRADRQALLVDVERRRVQSRPGQRRRHSRAGTCCPAHAPGRRQNLRCPCWAAASASRCHLHRATRMPRVRRSAVIAGSLSTGRGALVEIDASASCR